MSYALFSALYSLPPSFSRLPKGKELRKEESAGARLVCAHCFSLRCGRVYKYRYYQAIWRIRAKRRRPPIKLTAPYSWWGDQPGAAMRRRKLHLSSVPQACRKRRKGLQCTAIVHIFQVLKWGKMETRFLFPP